MLPLSSDMPDNIAAWVAAIMAALALGDRMRTYYKNRKRDKNQLEEAFDKAPQVRQQLELGNFKGAIDALLTIQEAQRQAYESLSSRYANLERENEGLHIEIRELQAEIKDLKHA